MLCYTVLSPQFLNAYKCDNDLKYFVQVILSDCLASVLVTEALVLVPSQGVQKCWFMFILPLRTMY